MLILCNTWAIVSPVPIVAPLTSVSPAVQINVVPATLPVNSIEGANPEQIVCAGGVAVNTGRGLTVTVSKIVVPGHGPAVGVIE